MAAELMSFLSLDSRLDLKSAALQYVLGLTGSDEGRTFIKSQLSVVKVLLDLTTDPQPLVSRDAHLALLNISGVDEVVEYLIKVNAFPKFLEFIADPNWREADKVGMILSNVTRTERGTEAFLNSLEAGGSHSLYWLIDIFCREGFSKFTSHHYLATVFLNLTQSSRARELFLDQKRCIVPKLLPYTHYLASEIRRGGVIGLLRNLCFEVGSHQWLLSEEVELLPSLLLPLAGPEQLGDEEMERLPEDLQFLPDDKAREVDPDIRRMLIEALMKLCATKFGREYLRHKGSYYILRELHKWESDSAARTACENLVHILISDEPDAGMENLHTVEQSKTLGATSTMQLEPPTN